MENEGPIQEVAHCWRLILNILLTREELAKMEVVSGNHIVVCALCFNKEASVPHLLFNCLFTL